MHDSNDQQRNTCRPRLASALPQSVRAAHAVNTAQPTVLGCAEGGVPGRPYVSAGVACIPTTWHSWRHLALALTVWCACLQPKLVVVAVLGGYLPKPLAGEEGRCTTACAAWHC